MVAFNKSDINTREETKNYEGYNNQKLKGTRGGKTAKIFESSKLNKDDGTLDTTKLQDLAELLHIYKTAKAQAADLNSKVADWAPLLGTLWREKRNNSDFYQLINNRGRGGKIDLVIEKLEDRLFKKLGDVNPSKQVEYEAKHRKLADLAAKDKKADEEIKVLEKQYNPKLLQDQTNLEGKVALAVTALKNDLGTPGRGGRKFFEEVIKYNRISSEEMYRSDVPATTNSYGSIIQTGYTTNGKPFTHPIYLSVDFQGQIWTILKDVNKDKLINYISSADCTWNANDKEKFKKVFNRVVELKLKPWNPGDKSSMAGLSNEGYVRENIETHRYMSDVLYVMHALFPKDSDYKNSPFLKVGESSCLAFNDTDKNVDTPYTILWRGEDASIKGTNYITAPNGNISIMKAPFSCEEKHLTWANGQIPEFFWQVYNSDDAIDFSARHTVMGSDAVADSQLIRDEISVYEKKLRSSFLSPATKGLTTVDIVLVANYKKYVENLIKNLKDGDGNNLFTDEEVMSLEKEWGGIAGKMLKDFIFKTFSTFSQRAKNVTYQAIEDKKSSFTHPDTIKLIEIYKGGDGIDSITDPVTDSKSVINEWDEWSIIITESKRENLQKAGAELGKKWSERKQITVEENKVKQELEALKAVTKTTLGNNLVEVRKQFKLVYDHPMSGSVKYKFADQMFMQGLLDWIEQRENEPDFSKDPAFTTQVYKTELENQKKALWGMLANYRAWILLSDKSFLERVEAWRKTMPGGGIYSEETLRAHLLVIKNELEKDSLTGLSVTEQAELEQINEYLSKPVEKQLITNADLRQALGIDIIPASLVYRWRNVENSEVFRTDAEKIKAITDKINRMADKTNFLNYLQTNLATDTNLPIFPREGSEKEKLAWFFTLEPSKVIKTTYAFSLNDNAEKERVKAEMNSKRDSNNLPLSRTEYGNGQEFTEEGMVKYLYQEALNLAHQYASIQTPEKETTEPPFLRLDNPYAWLSGLGVLALIGAVIAFFKWDSIMTWWNGSDEAEGNKDVEEEDNEDE